MSEQRKSPLQSFRLALLGVALFIPQGAAAAQQPIPTQQPTTAQVQQALQDPTLATQLRSRLSGSGMSRDEIHARLRAAGYPEDLLDDYLPGSAPGGAVPSQDALSAVEKISTLDAAAQEKQLPRPAPAPRPHSDIFGLDIFRSSTSRFDPLSAGPVDPSYRVGPRDVLALILTGDVEASYTMEVSLEGFVVIPQVGQLYVANLTLDQIRDLLFTRLHRVYSGVSRDPNATTKFVISVARVRANQVFVIGEAVAPGSYQVSSAGTMLTALYSAGGPSDNGGMRAVELRRGGRVIDTLDLYDYVVRGDASRDQRLQTGDVIFIPFHGKRATIEGEVGRPATFELVDGETLRDLVRYAGGLTPSASRHRIQIRRILPPSSRAERGGERVLLDIPPDQLENGEVPRFPIEGGDQVKVFGVTDVERNQVTVTGHVWAPGVLGMRPGMRLSDAIRAAGGVRPGVFTDQVLVTRQEPGESAPRQLRTSFADTTGRLTGDLVLQDRDSIRIFSRAEFTADRHVTVSGAVHRAGDVPFREGMTLRDAVLLAGGPAESAYLREAEIARVDTAADGTTSAKVFRVPLDSSYLFERGPDGKYLGPPGMSAPSARAPEVPLEAYDHVLILRQPEWSVERRVTVAGQVRFPGTYTLTSREERLADLIRRAGGIAERGYAAGAVFVRPSEKIGRIDVSLARALQDTTSRDNLVLQSGDSIYVPRYSPVVRVSGAVSSPSSIAYVPGKKLRYYVDAAGGTLPTGNLERAYVVQPNGTRQLYRHHWGPIPDRVPTPEAGAEVVVPEKPEEKRDVMAVLMPFTQLLTALATLTYLVARR